MNQQISTTAAEKKRFFLQQRYYNEGENTGHLLAMIARAQQGQTHIEAIQNVKCETVGVQEQISEAFSHFFQDLYTSKVHPTKAELDLFLDQCTLPCISRQGFDALNEPIKLEELSLAVVQMANNKSLGADRLPIETYKMYGDALLPTLLQTLNDALQDGGLP